MHSNMSVNKFRNGRIHLAYLIKNHAFTYVGDQVQTLMFPLKIYTYKIFCMFETPSKPKNFKISNYVKNNFQNLQV